MDEATIIKAKLMAAVLCRAVDYHTVSQSVARLVNEKSAKQTDEKCSLAMETAERAVAVALENYLDEGME